MNTPFNAEKSPQKWPDFYSVLQSAPETDAETLRTTINEMYVQANREIDHRELSKRFYFQVLSQKVLPQCRRILLDKTMREAYDQQWHLHREGAPAAIPYSEFIEEVNKKLGLASTALLTESELELLPSFESDSPAPSESGEADSGVAPTSSAATETTVPTGVASSAADAAPIAAPAAKKNPAILLGGLALLAIVGGVAWNASRSAAPPVPTPLTPPVAAPPANTSPQAPNFPVVTGDVSLQGPLSLSLDALTGTASGDAKSGPGLQSNALILGGTGALELPQTLDTLQSYTVMTWVKISNAKSAEIQSNRFQTFISADGPLDSAFFLQLRGDTNRFAFSTLPQGGALMATYAGATGDYKLGQWYHLAGVRDAKKQTLALYVNGQLQSTVPFTQAYRAPGTLRLGRAKYENKPVDFLIGALDNVQITQSALSGAQILAAAKPLLAKANAG